MKDWASAPVIVFLSHCRPNRSLERLSCPSGIPQIFDESDLIFAASIPPEAVSIDTRKTIMEVLFMQSDCPGFEAPQKQTEPKKPASRLTDEKISDESGTESNTQSALAPAGLKNPFWN
jgi:hypothetical protein